MKFCQGCAFLAALAAPLTARATTFDHHWCFNWKAVNLDTNIGEDFNLTSTWTARGARIGVQHAVAGNQPVMYTNVGTGCVDFQSTASSNFTVTIYAETKVGASGNIIVRSFATEANYVSWRDGPGAPSATLEQWLWLGVTPACTGTNCTLTMTNTSGTDPVSNMIAVGTQVLHKIDGETTPRISGTVELALINEPCGGAGGSGSCFRRESGEPHIAWIQSTDNGDQRKFLIAHETGHLLHDVRSGFPAWGGNPWVIATGHHTRCDSAGIPGAHALRSEELSSGAFIEGFAHYMATLTFNSHLSTSAWFKYYKDDTSTGGGVTYNFDLVDVEGSGASPAGGVSDWLHSANGCTCTATGCADRGVEMDWLRFLWDFRTDAGTQPTHAQIFNLTLDAAATHGLLSASLIQDWLEAEVPGALASRWDTLADANGADPTPD